MNYENVANATLSLFVLSSMEGWPDYMYQGIDSDVDAYGPTENGNQIYSLFYVIFLVIGSLFLLNLFVGALCYNFEKAQKNEKSGGITFMTPDQAKWIEMHRMLSKAEPEIIGKWVPSHGWRFKLYNMTRSNVFEVGIMMVILLNIMIMTLDYDTASVYYSYVLGLFNYAFTIIFICEMLIKIVALTPKGYLDSGWNRFDCFIVCASVVDISTQLFAGNTMSFLSFGPELIRIIRVFRITRILRLVKSLKGLQKLIETIMISIPSLLNVGALLFLVLFIYSVLGWFLFKNVTTGLRLGPLYNFSNFGYSFITLLRCMTGEDWPHFMYDVMRTDRSCIQG